MSTVVVPSPLFWSQKGWSEKDIKAPPILCWSLGCPKKTLFFSIVSGVQPLVLTSFQSPQKKFQNYRPINDTWRTILSLGSVVMGKEPPEGLKLATFKNWLDTRPKMETHEPNVYPTILGGVSRGFWSPFEDSGARSAIFWHLKTGTFAKMVG